MTKTRLEAFSDGVFAIVITLLVLEIRPAPGASSGAEMFAQALPHILVYALSFILVGLYWVAHHNMMHFVERVDRGMLWWNLALLLVVAFIPFPAAVLGATHADPGSIRLYCATLGLTNIMGAAVWMHATHRHRLVSPSLPAPFSRFISAIHLAPVAVYALAALLAGTFHLLSLLLIALVPLFFVLPNPILDRRVREAHSALQRSH